MFNFYNTQYQSGSSINWVSLLALLVSVSSIICSLYFIYLSKRVEILNSKFQKFCIGNLDEMFKPTDQKLKNNGIKLNTFKKEATDLFLEVQLYITILKKTYPKINIEEIISKIEEYTDYLYTKENLPLIEIRAGYIALKLTIYSLLYNYALAKELSLFERIGVKKYISKKRQLPTTRCKMLIA